MRDTRRTPRQQQLPSFTASRLIRQASMDMAKKQSAQQKTVWKVARSTRVVTSPKATEDPRHTRHQQGAARAPICPLCEIHY